MATLRATGLITAPVDVYQGTTRSGEPFTRRTFKLFTGHDVLEIRVPDQHVSYANSAVGQVVDISVEVDSYSNRPQYTLGGPYSTDALANIAEALVSAK